MSRKMIGPNGESIDLEAVEDLLNAQTDILLSYWVDVVDQVTEDEEERASAKVNFSGELSKLLFFSQVKGVLLGEEGFVDTLGYTATFEDE